MTGSQQTLSNARSVSYTYNDTDLLSSQIFNNWLSGVQIAGLPNYTVKTADSTAPFYTVVNVKGIPTVSNCSAFGFGCALSLVFPQTAQGYFGSGVITSLPNPAGAVNTVAWLTAEPGSDSSSGGSSGHGRKLYSVGKVNIFTLSSASALQGGMCQRVNENVMPRPSSAVTGQVRGS
jgi:hypothetical protein